MNAKEQGNRTVLEIHGKGAKDRVVPIKAELAADIADKTIANDIKNGISEHYDSISGKPLGVRDYCMSCTLVTMMLDGLTRKHQLKLRDGAPGSPG